MAIDRYKTVFNMAPSHGAVGASGPMGAMGPTGWHGAAGANGPPGPYVIRDSDQSNTLHFNDSNGTILKITKDGIVEWYGKPSRAADVLERTIGHMIDGKVASSGMRQRTYIRACQSILSRSRNLSKEEIIAMLEDSISNRESKHMVMALEELARLDESEG